MEIFFAYIGQAEQFDAATHARVDERVESLLISQIEGEFPGASVSIQARPDGYLRLGRRVAISCEHGGTIYPLLVGTITGAPLGLDGEFVTLELIGKNPGWQSAQEALIEGAAVAPFFDPLFVSRDQIRDPAAVLTGRGATIAWDRVTGQPRLSDILDGPRTLTLPRIRKGTLVPDVEGAVLSAVELEIAAGWSQDASAISEVSWEHGAQLEVVADKALAEAWPKPQEEIGGNWRILDSELHLRRDRYVDLGEIPAEYDSAIYSGDVPVYRAQVARVSVMNPRSQAREERLTVRLDADVQDLSENSVERLSVSLRDLIGEGDDVDPWAPTASYEIGDIVFYAGKLYEAAADHTGGYAFDASQWSELPPYQGKIAETFFKTARGQAALAHAVERCRARLRYAARAVRVVFEIPMEDCLDLQIDDRVSVSHPAMPGQTMTGKVVRYEFHAGNDGSRVAIVEIACAVGRGGAQDAQQPDTSPLSPPALGPTDFPATGRVSPVATAQIEALRQAPDAYDISIRVEIDAPAVPVAPLLAYSKTLSAGTISIEKGVALEQGVAAA